MSDKFSMIRLFILPVFTLLLGISFSGMEHSETVATISAEETYYPEHLTGAFTGGAGEETCRSCHFDYDLNPDGGELSVGGIPENISAGEVAKIKITVKREELGAAGFQLSARYEDGSQAGRFDIEGDDRIMFSNAVPDSLQYVQHTSEGTKPSQKSTSSWIVKWEAPESAEGAVIFNIAVNAANGDQSEFGDYIYAEKLQVNVKD